MLLRLTDGTTTIVIHNDGGSVATGLLGAIYIPKPGTGDSVAETATVTFSGTSSQVITTLNSIEAMLRRGAESMQNPALPKIYAEYKHGANATVYRSRIIGGRLEFPENRSLRNLAGTTTAGQVAMILERVPYWEAPVDTLGTDVLRNGDASPFNRLALNAPQGTMPAPVKVQIENTSGATLNSRMFYLAMDNSIGISGSTHLINGGSTTWGVNLTHSTRLHTLDIPNSIISGAKGQRMSIIAAFTSLVETNLYLKASLWTSYSGVYVPTGVEGGEVLVNGRKLINLGALPVPPDGSSTDGLAVALTGFSANAGSSTLDFLQVVPAKNAMRIEQTSYGLGVNESHIWDGIENELYHLSGSARRAILRKSGGPLMVHPGQSNRLFMLFDEGNSYTASRQMTVTVSYRARYSTIAP